MLSRNPPNFILNSHSPPSRRRNDLKSFLVYLKLIRHNLRRSWHGWASKLSLMLTLRRLPRCDDELMAARLIVAWNGYWKISVTRATSQHWTFHSLSLSSTHLRSVPENLFNLCSMWSHWSDGDGSIIRPLISNTMCVTLQSYSGDVLQRPESLIPAF